MSVEIRCAELPHPVLSAGLLPEQQQVAGAGPGYEGGGGLVLRLPAGHPGASHPAAA